MKAPRKVVLAYSGGLDTSVIVKWLRQTYDCEVVAYTADLGQGDDMEAVARKARETGAGEVVVEDLREVFVRDYVYPMLRANALYEGVYMLGTSIARPLIAKRQVEVAREKGADAVAHGATGKGNDQVRFELGYAAWGPELQVVAPWRLWDLHSREALVAYGRQQGIDVPVDKEGEAEFSRDANLLHISSEGKMLEDPATPAPRHTYTWTTAPEDAPDEGEEFTLGYERGDAVALNGEELSPAEMLARLNEMGGRHGVGRIDMVENRFVGMKSRGVYETPGGTILLAAHRGVEQLTLDGGSVHLKDEMMPRYAELVYNGFWDAPERRMLQALVDESQQYVSGEVRLVLYKGRVEVRSRTSAQSLYSEDLATFGEGGGFDHADAEGFIRLQGLRLKMLAHRRRANEKRR